MANENKRFHITIKDNETGEIKIEHDANVILGSCVLNEHQTTTIVAIKGNAYDIAIAMDAVHAAIKQAGEQCPEALLLSLLIGMHDKDKETVVKTEI